MYATRENVEIAGKMSEVSTKMEIVGMADLGDLIWTC